MKVVINTRVGFFGLSKEAYDYLGLEWDGHGELHNLSKKFEDVFNLQNREYINPSDLEIRTSPKLIECIETLGEAANGRWAELKVVEVPDDIPVYIEVHDDGCEHVAEVHRIWS